MKGWRKLLLATLSLVVIMGLAMHGKLTDTAAYAVVGVLSAFCGGNAMEWLSKARVPK